MAAFEDNTHVFIVRIWLEPREVDGAIPAWRGMIEHVPSGTRRYVIEAAEILMFIASFTGA